MKQLKGVPFCFLMNRCSPKGHEFLGAACREWVQRGLAR